MVALCCEYSEYINMDDFNTDHYGPETSNYKTINQLRMET